MDSCSKWMILILFSEFFVSYCKRNRISFVCKQISKSCGIIFRSRYCLSSNTKLTLYYTLIYPYITYCNSAWSSTYVTNLNRIFLFSKTSCASYCQLRLSRTYCSLNAVVFNLKVANKWWWWWWPFKQVQCNPAIRPPLYFRHFVLARTKT